MTEPATNIVTLKPSTKRCWRCTTTRPVGAFNKDKSRPDGLQPICRLCARAVREERKLRDPDAQRRAYQKWYAKPENAAKVNAATVKHRRERADALVKRLKSAPCMDCKQSFPSYCMDFDHRPGTEKKFCLNWGAMQYRSLEDILDEMAKCDLVCAICHRIRTAARNQTGRKA